MIILLNVITPLYFCTRLKHFPTVKILAACLSCFIFFTIFFVSMPPYPPGEWCMWHLTLCQKINLRTSKKNLQNINDKIWPYDSITSLLYYYIFSSPYFPNQNENKKTKQHKRNILPKLLFCTSQLYLYWPK